MDKKLIDRAWRILPAEFKRVVKAHYAGLNAAYKAYLSKDSLTNEECDRCKAIREKISIYSMYFGIHNLTSDAEGEDEILCVSRKRVQEMYYYNEDILFIDPTHSGAILLKKKLQDLFGSKCLPDEKEFAENANCKESKPAEPKFKVGDKVKIVKNGNVYNNSIGEIIDISSNGSAYILFCNGQAWFRLIDLEPYTEPEKPTRKEAKENENTFAFDKPTNTKSDGFDNILKDIFRNHNRLHIAAMMMQGILSNADRMKQYGEIAMRESETLTQLVARNALRYADALIAEAEKGGEK